jgi:Predicted membrane protein
MDYMKKQIKKNRNKINIASKCFTIFCIILFLTFILEGCSGKSTQPGQDSMDNIGQSGSMAEAAQEPLQNLKRQTKSSGNTQQITKNINKTASNKNNKNYIGKKKAKKKALKHSSISNEKVTFTKVKLEYGNGIPEYEIKFKTSTHRYEYEINARNGKILKSSKKLIRKNQSNTQNKKLISRKKAKKAALDYLKIDSSKVKRFKIELEYENGKAEYEIELYANKTEYSFTIDAVTGKILEMEIDRD